MIYIDQYIPVLHTSEEYSADAVTVTVEWTEQVGALYDVGVVPVVPINCVYWKCESSTDSFIQH